MRKIVFEKVIKTIKKYELLSKNDRVIIAISGGADSVSLTHLLSCLRNKYLLKLHLLHFRHGLRNKKEEEKDLKIVTNLAKKLFLPLTVKKIKVREFAREKKIGLEESARILRYQYLTKFAKEHNFNKIVTGHTLDDQAETVLFNLIRGAGLTGLSGIPVYREENTIGIMRPLLKVTKNEILQYLKKENLSYSQDLTNLQL
ncbi:MAG TPA: tRNA lysidine(34) synthetase TilS, partial [Elusimicrobia bacterium]|nr:tRNA lysidine(34) synthetase TilS [Elusimicrobiota bacterium]